MGCAPAVTARFTGHADYPASFILQLHAIVFPGWLVLLTVQALLIGIRRPALHRLLGLTGFVFVPVMVVTGVWSEILSQRHYSVTDPANQSFFIIPLAYMAVFPLLAGAGLWMRKSPTAHKRLMLLATAWIVAAAYARWWGAGLAVLTGDGYAGMLVTVYAGFYLLAAVAMAYDFATRGHVHRVYLVAVPLVIVAQMIVSIVYHAPEWRPVARWIAGI